MPQFMSDVASGGRWVLARLRSKRLWGFVFVAGAAGLVAIGYEAALRARIHPPDARAPTALYTRGTPWGGEGRPAEPLFICAVSVGPSEYRVPVRLDQVPDRLIQAALAVEDQRFYDHRGLDFRRIGGAALANLKSGAIRQGGSTITQQLAKNLFLSSRRTPLRKLREAAMAAVLEERYDKPTILEAYLNEIYLGQDGGDGIHGVGAAARHYFGKTVADLTLAEVALLAGMIRAPNRYHPVRNPATARERRDLVLGLMRAQGRIGERDARRAGRERLPSRIHARRAVEAPYFRDFVLASGSTRSLAPRGTALVTTLDANLQRAAARAVREGLNRLRRPDAQAALVALDPRSGELLAMIGGRDYGVSQFNRAADAMRQPGSAFKPVVALAALGREGRNDPAFTLASVIEDGPLQVRTSAGLWVPANYDGEFRGPVTFRDALEQSLNVPFARIGLEVGPERIVRTARALGIASPLQAVPSLALGASEVSPLELTRAYGVLAAGGRLAPLRTLLPREREERGAVETIGDRVADPAEVYLVTSALEGVIARGTGRGLASVGGWGGLAGKSGTSNDWRDAWFVAYTPSLVVGVWVGHDDNRSLGTSGAGAALPIVSRFLRDALDGERLEEFPVPDGIELGWAESSGGAWWNGWRCEGRREVFLEGTAPEARCRAFDWPERWGGGVERRVREFIEILEQYGEEAVERFLERLAERGGRGRR